MPRKGLGFRPTLREQREDVNRALDHYAILSGRPTPEGLKNVIAPKREQAQRRNLEGPVVAAISELLAVHPKVSIAVRQNSGMAYSGAAPVRFYRLITNTKTQTIVDFWGLLKDGRMYAFEVKAPGFKLPRDDRERKQANFLNTVRNCGGVAKFVTDVDQVAEAFATEVCPF